jgi:hypothetical protein
VNPSLFSLYRSLFFFPPLTDAAHRGTRRCYHRCQHRAGYRRRGCCRFLRGWPHQCYPRECIRSIDATFDTGRDVLRCTRSVRLERFFPDRRCFSDAGGPCVVRLYDGADTFSAIGVVVRQPAANRCYAYQRWHAHGRGGYERGDQRRLRGCGDSPAAIVNLLLRNRADADHQALVLWIAFVIRIVRFRLAFVQPTALGRRPPQRPELNPLAV